MDVPQLKMSNGNSIPALGLGTWQAEPGEVEKAVKLAIDLGYRNFDCARVYRNEAEVGAALREKIKEGAVKREDLFVTSKLWNTYHNPDLVVAACQTTLDNFGLEYLDLYLIHWPFAFKEHKDYFPRDENGKILFADYDYVDTWKEMEKCVELGLVKSIGLSNFNSHQIERVLKSAKIKPVMNQVECHPYLNQKKLIQFCKDRGIMITAYSPLGSPSRPWGRSEEPHLLSDPKLAAIANRVGRTPAQVALRYLVQLGVIPIPKSTNAKRLLENIDVFNFELGDKDVKEMDELNINYRYCQFRDKSLLAPQKYKVSCDLHERSVQSLFPKLQLMNHEVAPLPKQPEPHDDKRQFVRDFTGGRCVSSCCNSKTNFSDSVQAITPEQQKDFSNNMVVIPPTVKLNNGRRMPVLGLGTYKMQKDAGKEVIKAAIDAGYRHIDTALLYHSEDVIGEAVREKIAEGTIKREDLFITSKLWCSYAHPGLVVKGCKRTLKNLGLDYIDLYLIHQPFSFKAIPTPDDPVTKEISDSAALFAVEEYFPRDASGNIIMTDVDYVDTWKEMEECVRKGMTKSIGVSNFNAEQIERILQNASIKPVVNQVEMHPYLNQKKLMQFCKERGIYLTGYSPLKAGNLGEANGPLGVLEDPTIVKIAKEVHKSPAQVILRYLVQLGAIVIPKTENPKRLAENIAIFDFTLSPEQMAEMDSLNRNQRGSIVPGTENHKYYPFKTEF